VPRFYIFIRKRSASIVRKKGGRPDSNRRPPEPQSGFAKLKEEDMPLV